MFNFNEFSICSNNYIPTVWLTQVILVFSSEVLKHVLGLFILVMLVLFSLILLWSFMIFFCLKTFCWRHLCKDDCWQLTQYLWLIVGYSSQYDLDCSIRFCHVIIGMSNFSACAILFDYHELLVITLESKLFQLVVFLIIYVNI